MYENQFINFYEDYEELLQSDVVLPICNGDKFFNDIIVNGATHTFSLVDAGDTSVVLINNVQSGSGNNHITIGNLTGSVYGKCCRIRLAINEDGDITYYYTKPVKPFALNDALLSKVEYWCDEDTFDIPFATLSKHIVQHLPIILRDPQLATKEEVYEKLNGEKVVLYSTIKKEHTLETDYIPEEWHDKLVVALSCDHVKINNVSVHKDGDYTIDWEKCRLVGSTRTSKGEAKIQQNFNSRNSN